MNQSIRRIPALLFLAALAAAVLAIPASAADPNVVPGHYIVVFKDSVDKPGDLARTQTKQRDGDLGFIYSTVLKGYSAELSPQAVEALRSDPRVKAVRPDHRVVSAAQTVPTGIDRVFATVKGILDIDEQDDLRVDVDVAVLDTGIDEEHPDLDVVARTYCDGTKESATCTDNTGTDEDSHGTHVAGTIGAIDNGYGVVGVAPGARLWSVKVLDPGASESELVAGIKWVTDHASEIEVANMSIGCSSLPCSLPSMSEALSSSVKKGVVYAVAAGNNGVDAKYSTFGTNPDLITVSALADYDGKTGGKAEPSCVNRGEDDTLASFSNWGKDVEIAAPGVCILSTVPGGGYSEAFWGTSMASPHVAGAAAILAAASNPETKADVEAIRDALLEAGNLEWKDTSEDGVQEPLLDLTDLVSTPELIAASGEATTVEGARATLNGTVTPRGLKTTYQFEYGTTTSYGSKAPVPAASVGSGTSPVEVSETISGLAPETTYHYRLAATDEEATAYGEDLTFTTAPPEIEFDFQFGKSGASNGQFAGPSDLAIDSQGNVWVADSQNDRVQKFNAKGEYLSQFGKYGTASGQFDTPQGIGIDSQGNVWVADSQNDRVQKFNAKGEYLSQFGSGQLNEPSDVAIDLQGNPLVAEYGNGSILKFNSSGKYIRKLAEGGPRLTVDPEGNIWFPNADRVVRLDRSGNHLATIGVGQLESATSVAIDPARDVWVLEGDRIVQLDPEGEFVGEYGEYGSGEGQLYEPAGIAADAVGNLWVANTAGQSVQKWLRTQQTGWRTAGPGYVGIHEATLNAVINPEGVATSYHFEYDNGSTSSKSAGSGTQPVAVSTLVTDVEVGIAHKYRVVVATEFGTAYGDWREFTFQVPQGAVSAPKPGSVWRTKGKTFAELGKSSAKVETVGELEMTIPELEVTFYDCRQTGEGTLKQPAAIELSLTLSGCEIAGAEEACTVEPIELELAGEGGSLQGQEAWLMQIVTKGAECPWYPEAFVEEGEGGLSAEFGMESIGLPVEMHGSALLSEGQLPVQLSGYSIWEFAQGTVNHGFEFGLG